MGGFDPARGGKEALTQVETRLVLDCSANWKYVKAPFRGGFDKNAIEFLEARARCSSPHSSHLNGLQADDKILGIAKET